MSGLYDEQECSGCGQHLDSTTHMFECGEDWWAESEQKDVTPAP